MADALAEQELAKFECFFKGVADEPLCEADRTTLLAYLNWKCSPKESGVPIGPVRVLPGDTVLWREKLYVVTAAFKSSVHLEGRHYSIKIRCLKPLDEGGFSEARVVRRAGF